MKKLVSLTLLIVFALSAVAQIQPRWGTYNLYDKVKRLTSVTVYDGANDLNYQETYKFDTSGNLNTYIRKGFGQKQTVNYPLEIEPDSLVRSDFDKDNDIVERRQFHPDGTLYHSSHYVYSAPHQLIMIIDYE